MDAARRSKRYPSDRPLAVRCDTWADFVELYAGDIGQGGMFILTNEPPPILSVIDIRMQLPEATDFMLRGRVVHVIDPEQAQLDGRPAGIGIEFVDLDPVRKKQIFQVIEFARWQGNDPNASLQRAMAEASQSLPPRQVGSSLPAPNKEASVAPNPRKVTLDGEKPVRRPDPNQARDSRKVTMDVEKQAPRDPRKATLDGERPAQRANSQDLRDVRKVTLDGEKPVRVTSRPASGPISTPTPPPGGKTSSDAPGSSGSSSDKLGAVKTDSVKIKSVVTHFAHKRYDAALKELNEVLALNAQDPQALKWQAMCNARKAIAGNDTAGAVQHYEKALSLDEGNREARDYVRNFHRDQRIASLPFGRYFTKKK